jgi:hypothetical protein
MKWELEKVLFLPIGDEKKEWMPSKNLKKLIGWDNLHQTSHNELRRIFIRRSIFNFMD